MTSETHHHSNAVRDYFERVDGNVYTGTVDIHPPDSSDPEALQRYYLQSLLRQLNQVELSGIDRKAAGQQQDSSLQLSAIYTALLTLSAEQDDFMPDDDSTPSAEKRLSALAQVNLHQHLVLLGEPGSGKSTFVKFTALCLAGALLGDEWINLQLLTTPLAKKEGDRETPPSPQPWDHGALLPVLVILRDFAAKGLAPEAQTSPGRALWDFIVASLENVLLKDFIPHLQTHLREQGGLILLDGLDEVPEADRRRIQIKQTVEHFRQLFPLCRIVVTSRTYAYQQQEWRLQGFADTVLAPFSEAQINFFVEHWYGYLAAIRGMDRENAQGRAELLKRTISHSERLQDFARRPLLLTLMASLHAWRGGSLPEKRGELYAEATDLLLNWWEQAKVVKTPGGQTVIEQPCLAEVLQVGQERIFQALTELAFQAHAGQSDLNSTANIAEEDLLAALFATSKNKDLRPGRLIEFLSERAGLLISHGNQLYTFPHRSFQEYLAACYLTENEVEEEEYPENAALLIRRDPERWREVVLLAAAKASSGSLRMNWLMVDTFCEFPPDDPDVDAGDAWCALLAGQALVETIDLQQVSSRNQRKVNRLRDWMAAILTEQFPKEAPFPAVERTRAGNILAVLGDPRPGVGLRKDDLPDIEWCEVPEGKFQMGTNSEQINLKSILEEVRIRYNSSEQALEKLQRWIEAEHPQHEVFLSSYYINRYPVTNIQYQTFIREKGYTTEDYWTEEGWAWKREQKVDVPKNFGAEFNLPNHPVVGVSWYEANAFCSWLTANLQLTGELSETQEIRLPTEAEWEKTARGTDARMYPWGKNEITSELANSDKAGLGVTSAVGCFPRGASPYGCEEMSGNVWEWCSDWFDDGYYVRSSEENPKGPDSGTDRITRGGRWESVSNGCRSSYRRNSEPDSRDFRFGFRLVKANKNSV